MKISIKRAVTEAVPGELDVCVQEMDAWDPDPEVVLLASSRDWLLARAMGSGFEPDGYFTIARSLVRGIHTTRHRAFRKRVLQTEQIWPSVLRIPSIDLQDAATILKSLQKLQRFAIVVRETFNEWRTIHCRVEEVTEGYAALLAFDGAGRWDRRPIRVEISEITRIHFGSRYLTLYEKYAEKPASRDRERRRA